MLGLTKVAEPDDQGRISVAKAAFDSSAGSSVASRRHTVAFRLR